MGAVFSRKSFVSLPLFLYIITAFFSDHFDRLYKILLHLQTEKQIEEMCFFKESISFIFALISMRIITRRQRISILLACIPLTPSLFLNKEINRKYSKVLFLQLVTGGFKEGNSVKSPTTCNLSPY